MTIAQVGTDQPFAFTDGNAGHSCAFGSNPSAGDWDIIRVASNTTVNTPTGFTLLTSRIINMGAYIFGRKAAGGESGTVSIVTNGNEPTAVIWTRLSGADLVDDPNGVVATGVDASVGGATPTGTTGTLAGTGEAVVVLGALSSIGTANQSAPVWTGPTAGTTATNGSGTSGVRAYSALKLGAGTAAESASVSWSGDGAFNRYTLMVTLTPAAAAGETMDLSGSTGPATGLDTFASTTVVLAGSTGPATGTLVAASPISITGGGSTGAATGAMVFRLTGEAEERPGSWWGLDDISKEWALRRAEERARPPSACPNDGEPLQMGPDGRLFCPFDGWRPS